MHPAPKTALSRRYLSSEWPVQRDRAHAASSLTSSLYRSSENRTALSPGRASAMVQYMTPLTAAGSFTARYRTAEAIFSYPAPAAQPVPSTPWSPGRRGSPHRALR